MGKTGPGRASASTGTPALRSHLIRPTADILGLSVGRPKERGQHLLEVLCSVRMPSCGAPRSTARCLLKSRGRSSGLAATSAEIPLQHLTERSL